MTEKRGLTPRFFVAPVVIARSTCDEAIQSYLLQKTGLLRFARNDSMNRMLLHRPITAARIVLDDRSRLPWRFFGRLTTAALTA
jgi:hypothetical protein